MIINYYIMHDASIHHCLYLMLSELINNILSNRFNIYIIYTRILALIME